MQRWVVGSVSLGDTAVRDLTEFTVRLTLARSIRSTRATRISGSRLSTSADICSRLTF
jgi:hypothetical protein